MTPGGRCGLFFVLVCFWGSALHFRSLELLAEQASLTKSNVRHWPWREVRLGQAALQVVCLCSAAVQSLHNVDLILACGISLRVLYSLFCLIMMEFFWGISFFTRYHNFNYVIIICWR